MVLMTVLLIVQGCSDVIEDDVTITVGGWARDRVESSYTVPGDPDKKKKSYKYEVVIEDWDYDVEAFLMRAATGQLPTIYDVAYTDMERIKNSGYGTDITDYLEKGYTDFLDGRILELISKDGRIYAIPSQVYVMGMLFNAELFREAGLQRLDGSYVLPQTLDELVEIAKIIRDRTGASGFLLPVDGNTGGWVFSNIAWEFGVEFIIKDKEGNWKANFDTPECVKALQWVKELKWKHDILPENPFTNQEQSWALLASGQSAMLMDDPYRSINKIITDYGIQKDDIGVFTLPAGPEGRIALMGGALLCINNTATEEELSLIHI